MSHQYRNRQNTFLHGVARQSRRNESVPDEGHMTYIRRNRIGIHHVAFRDALRPVNRIRAEKKGNISNQSAGAAQNASAMKDTHSTTISERIVLAMTETASKSWSSVRKQTRDLNVNCDTEEIQQCLTNKLVGKDEPEQSQNPENQSN